MLAALAAGTTVPAAAHELPLGVRNVLDRVSPHIDGVTIQVVRSVTDQLVAENRGPHDLEVLAPTGEAFLRIGPTGVQANLASPSWYLTNSVEGTVAVPPAAHAGAPPQWVTASSTLHSWGWFDHRLHPAGVTAPPDAKPRRLASWTIPMRYDGNPFTVSGHLQYRLPIGFLEAQLASTRIAPGVFVVVGQGRIPAMVVTVANSVSLVVLGTNGEPFFRVTEGRAEVNDASPTWFLTAAAQGSAPTGPIDAKGPPRWQPAPFQGTASWLEPRARATDPPDRQQHRTRVVRRWSVPLLVNGRSAHITGFTEWVPLRPSSSHGSGAPVTAVVAALVLLFVVGEAAAERRRSPDLGESASG